MYVYILGIYLPLQCGACWWTVSFNLTFVGFPIHLGNLLDQFTQSLFEVDCAGNTQYVPIQTLVADSV